MKTPVAPHDLEAERAVLGAILLDNSTLRLVQGELETGDFYNDANRTIYDAMLKTSERGPIDFMTLAAELRKDGALEKLGGPMAIAGLTDQVATIVNAPDYARIVRKKADARSILQAARDIASRVYDNPDDVDALATAARSRIIQATTRVHGRSSMFKFGEGIKEQIDRFASGEPPVDIVKTHIKEVDKIIGGLVRGVVTIVAGRPSHGKSAFLLNLIVGMAQAGSRCVYFSLEDTRAINQRRALSRFANIDSMRFVRNEQKFNDEEISQMRGAAMKLQNIPLWMSDHGMTPAQIEQCVMAQQARHGVDVVVVDHLGYIPVAGKTPYERTSEAMKAVTSIARTLNVPVVLAVQLNRGPENRPDKKPSVSDMRDSGITDEHARQVLLAFWEWKYTNEPADFNRWELIVGKNSHGQTGNISLACDMPHMWIGDTESREKDYDLPIGY